MRGKGQSFEEFQNACVEAFGKAGMLTEDPLSDSPKDYPTKKFGPR